MLQRTARPRTAGSGVSASSPEPEQTEPPLPKSVRRIRVAHLLHTIAFGGPETIILNWLRALDPERFECHVVCFANPGGTEKPFVQAAERAQIPVRFIPWARRKPLIRSARAMAAIIHELDIDVIHCYNTYADVVGVLVKWMTGVRIITTLWVWGSLGWKRAGLQLVERCVLPFFDRVTAQSEDARRDTIQPGVPGEKVSVLISGFTEKPVVMGAEERKRQRQELGASDSDFVLVQLARFWPEKAHDVMLDAFHIIHAARPEARLWLAGVGPEQDQIRALASKLGLSAAVRFLGFRSDLPNLLALADMQVHSSHAEGVPLALCAGMAAGLPIVATKVGGIPEIIHHERTGVLVPPGRPDLLAQAALELMDDTGKRRGLGSSAKRFLESEYSLEQAAARLEAVYLGMVP
jgi:glycosyltransferase involved in cell wall biosynthesis